MQALARADFQIKIGKISLKSKAFMMIMFIRNLILIDSIFLDILVTFISPTNYLL